MLPMLRLMFVMLVVLTFVYIGLSIYSRRVRRAKLEARWDSKDVLTTNREDFIERGLKKYDASFRRKLILGVYVVPFTIVIVLVYVTNFM